ncbi:MAG: hypothetical protein ACO1N9_09360 [Flavobacterium sp.]
MKKILLIILIMLALTACGSKKKAATEDEPVKPEVQYRDDFRATTAAKKNKLLKTLKATGKNYSVLIFTKGFKGEQITVSSNGKTLYRGNQISNLKTGIADQVRIINTADTKVFDGLSKAEVTLPAEETQKHKYVYLMKDEDGKGSPFVITYSNTLRPLE